MVTSTTWGPWSLPLLRGTCDFLRYVSSQLRCFRAGLASKGTHLLTSILATGCKAGTITLKSYK